MNAVQSAMYLEFHFLKGQGAEGTGKRVKELLIQRVINAHFTDNFSRILCFKT
jgi:hypothetical protein